MATKPPLDFTGILGEVAPCRVLKIHMNFKLRISDQGCSGVASGYSKYSLNALQFSGKIKTAMLIVSEMANVVAFQTFSSSKLQYSER